MCSSTGDYNEWINKLSDDDHKDEKTIPNWFYQTYCDECEKYIKFV